MYRTRSERLEFLLVHPGGPVWHNKDAGAWSIPKGEIGKNEDMLDTAKREFEEELGCKPGGSVLPLAPIKQKSGKVVHAWAMEGDLDPKQIKSNSFEIEWPPRSGKRQSFPEVDRAEWFEFDAARIKINPAQVSFLEEVQRKLGKSI